MKFIEKENTLKWVYGYDPKIKIGSYIIHITDYDNKQFSKVGIVIKLVPSSKNPEAGSSIQLEDGNITCIYSDSKYILLDIEEITFSKMINKT